MGCDSLAQLRRDVRWGLGWGVGFATFFSTVALVIYVVRGTRSFAANEVTFLQTILLYFGGGVSAGVIAGVLRRFTWTRRGAMAVGSIAGVPFMFGVLTTTEGLPSAWTGSQVAGAVIGGIIIGSVYAWWLWEPPNADDQRSP